MRRCYAIPAFYEDVDLLVQAQDALGRLRPFPIYSVNTGIREAWRDHPTTCRVWMMLQYLQMFNVECPDSQTGILSGPVANSPFLSNPELVCGLLQRAGWLAEWNESFKDYVITE